MSFYERILHAILFEIGALSVSTLAVFFLGLANASEAAQTSVVLAITALVWNFVFNAIFDKFATGKREERSLKVRLLHTVLFELTLVILTVPMIAYILNISWLDALLADIFLTLIIMAYAFIFNYLYDHLRLKFIKTPN